MAVLGQNLCSPPRIYGPVAQTLLCGCSIKSFSASAGWNEQSSNVTVELVPDTECIAPKIWWDANLTRHEASIADPGFTYPEPGCAIYFRIEENPDGNTEAERGGFEYCGIIESWTEKKGSDGNPIYTLSLRDPRVILENTQIIVNEYPGSTAGVFNLLNAYGFIESFGNSCSSSPAGGIGGKTASNLTGAIVNDRGMVWNDLKCAVQTLTSSFNPLSWNLSPYSNFCRDGRLVYVGPKPSQEGYGVIHSDDEHTGNFLLIPNACKYKNHYLVDLSEIPLSADAYRVSGPNISLAELISQVCQDVGADYYCELLPVKSGSQVLKIIKIRVALRSSQLQLGRIDDFIQAKTDQANQANGGVINYVKGEEVRNEETSIYLMGPNRLDPYEADLTQMLPYWGLDTNGSLIQAQIIAGEYYVRLDFARINSTLFVPLPSQYVWISETELRAALNSQESFFEQAEVKGGAIASYFASVAKLSGLLHTKLADAIYNVIPAFAAYRGFDDDLKTQVFDDQSALDENKIYEFIRNYASEYYGKQFLVKAPFVCYAMDVESEQLKYSHEPSNDGCWVNDSTSTVLGLIHNSTASDFFRDESGKYSPIVAFPLISTNLSAVGSYESDPSKLNPENYISDGVNFIWTKGSLENDWVFGTPLNPSASIISAVIKIDAATIAKEPDGEFSVDPAFAGINNLATDINATEIKTEITPDRGTLTFGLESLALAPYAAMCPVKNNLLVYGPWGVAGLPGQVRFEQDDGFNPWEYGSDQLMNQAALSKVDQAVTQMRKGERGSILVAGYPNIPLGAELFSVDTNNPPNSQKFQKYIGTRTYSVGYCTIIATIYCSMNQWVGDFGPNVTNINVQVGDGGFTTEYQFNTYTPQFGRFSKGNSEKLKRIGQNRLKGMRNLRAQQAFQNKLASSIQIGRQLNYINQKGSSARTPASPHHFLIAGYTHSGRINSNIQSVREASYAFQSDNVYAKNAICSLDALFRPVSKAGDGDLPRFTLFNVACEKDRTRQSDPPITGYERLQISQEYLDPFANPNDTILSERSSQSKASGHDIEVLARGDSGPISGWAIPEGEKAGVRGYEPDYRFLALRGPLLIQQWGYDEDSKPIPNAADNDEDAAVGTFVSTQLKDRFLDGWLQKPKTWPVAPLDLRLDRTRGVWTVPQPPRNVHANVQNCDTTGNLVNIRTVYDKSGEEVTNKGVEFEWPWDITQPSGLGKIPLYYDNVDCKYYAFPITRLDVHGRPTQYGSSGATGATGPNNDPCSLSNPANTDDPCSKITTGSLQKYKDVKTLEFAEGLVVEESMDGCGNTKVIVKAIQGLLCKSGWAGSGNCCGITFSGSSTCGASSPPFEPFKSNFIVAGTGITFNSVSFSGTCRSIISSNIFASGMPWGFKSCGEDQPSEIEGYNDDLTAGQDGPINQIFSMLSFVGRLSTTVDPNNKCAVIVSGLPSQFLLSGNPGCNSTVSKEAFHSSAVAFGSGLDLIKTEGQQSCYGIVHATPAVFKSKDRAGQKITKGTDCSSLLDEAEAPRPTCGAGDMEIDGPYKERRQGKYLNEIIAGHGVGITAFGKDSNCSLLIFNNHIDYGYDDSCGSISIGQVGSHLYSQDFEIKEESIEGGGAFESFDGSLATEILLSEGGEPWSATFVKAIEVAYDFVCGKKVVTCVSWDCGTISGTQSCSGKKWLKSIPVSSCEPPTEYITGCSGASGPTSSPTYQVKTSNYTMNEGESIAADTSGGAFTLTLPSSPAAGSAVFIKDIADFTVNNLTVARNGSTIEGYADDLICDIKGCVYTLVYDGATWELSANLGGDGGTSSS